MVFRRSKYRRSNTKRRYTKRRGGSHKRKVYRNKHGRKSYKMRRGGGFGTKTNCLAECYSYKLTNNPEAQKRCLKGCDNAFGQGPSDDNFSNNYPDSRNYVDDPVENYDPSNDRTMIN